MVHFTRTKRINEIYEHTHTHLVVVSIMLRIIEIDDSIRKSYTTTMRWWRMQNRQLSASAAANFSRKYCPSGEKSEAFHHDMRTGDSYANGKFLQCGVGMPILHFICASRTNEMVWSMFVRQTRRNSVTKIYCDSNFLCFPFCLPETSCTTENQSICCDFYFLPMLCRTWFFLICNLAWRLFWSNSKWYERMSS